MGLFNFFRKKQPRHQVSLETSYDLPQTLPLQSASPLNYPDQSLDPYSQPQAFQQQQKDNSDKDTQLILSKLDLIASRLETISRRLELLGNQDNARFNPYLQPRPPPQAFQRPPKVEPVFQHQDQSPDSYPPRQHW